MYIYIYTYRYIERERSDIERFAESSLGKNLWGPRGGSSSLSSGRTQHIHCLSHPRPQMAESLTKCFPRTIKARRYLPTIKYHLCKRQAKKLNDSMTASLPSHPFNQPHLNHPVLAVWLESPWITVNPYAPKIQKGSARFILPGRSVSRTNAA